MSVKSDITINVAKFGPGAIPQKTQELNEQLLVLSTSVPQWYEVGAQKFRQMRENGQSSFPKPVVLDQGKTMNIPSRENERQIPCRLMMPEDPTAQIQGTMMHVHGGGWVLNSEKSQDTFLQRCASAGSLAILSVGYRLAPETPFPGGYNDCIDVLEWLLRNAVTEFGGPLRFMGGESAGAHLVMLSTLYLLKTHPQHHLGGLLCNYGVFDLSWLPSVRNFKKFPLINHEALENFASAFLPGLSLEERKHPDISPYYADLMLLRGRLPRALFICGTNDCLIDDTIGMSLKWLMNGGEAIVKIVPGGCHGLLSFKSEGADEAWKSIVDFLGERK